MLTPEEIEFIRAWAASGNERLVVEVKGRLPGAVWEMDEDGVFCQLNPAGLTIAQQAERIRELETELSAAAWEEGRAAVEAESARLAGQPTRRIREGAL